MTVDVAVVGGGPGGLLAALGLLTALPQAKVKVYEKVKGYGECGAGIALVVNGLKAIKAISPTLYQRFEQHCDDFDTFDEVDYQGKVVAERSNVSAAQLHSQENLEQWGVKPGFLGWSDIQKMIYEALPEGTVQHGHALEGLQQHEQGVTLQFSGQPDVHADFVVAADGYFSPVREIVLDDGPPEFKDAIFWRARLPFQEGLGFSNKSMWGRLFIGTKRTAALYRLPGTTDTVGWSFSAHREVYEEAGVAYDAHAVATSKQRSRASSYQAAPAHGSSSAHENAVRAVGGFTPQFAEWVRATPPGAVVEHGLFTRSSDWVAGTAGRGWGRGRVTLVGDAAHPTRPTGQGLNLALEDAAELMGHVQASGLSEGTLRAFERGRVPRVVGIMRQEEGRGQLAYKRDALEAHNRVQQLPMKWDEYERYKNSWQPRVLHRQAPAARTPIMMSNIVRPSTLC